MARPRFICLLLALITVLAFLPLRQASFISFDDPDYITENSIVQAGLTTTGLKWAFTAFRASNWHPLTWVSHMIDCELFGPNSGAHHLINVLFHAANAVLLFLLLLRATKRIWPAAFVAALFAWHPLHIESVAWISERKDVLSTFFGLLALLAYVEKSSGQHRNPKSLSAVAVVCFALSLMAKPMLVTMPFVLLLLDYWPLRRFSAEKSLGATNLFTKRLISLALEKWPFFVLSAASCVITFLAQRNDAVVSLERFPFNLRLANSIVAYALYLWKTIWPVKLAILYPLSPEISPGHVVLAAFVLIGLSVAAWSLRKRSPSVLIGWLWFVGTLVPVIGLVQVGAQAMADRYTYIPLVGIFIALAFGVADFTKRFRPASPAIISLSAVSLAACLFATEYQLRFWQNSETLFGRAIRVTKNNAVAHTNLGVALEQQGRRDEALAEYRQAVELKPDLPQLHNNIANLLDELGRRDEALAEYQEALRLKPNAPLAHANYGSLLNELGRFDDAMREYQEAARLAPNDARPHYLMGKAFLRHGNTAEAVSHLREALRINGNDFQTMTWLARILAADESSAVRNGSEAVSLAEHANVLSDGQQPFVLDTLSMAYAEVGRFEEAQRTEDQAIQLSAGMKPDEIDSLRKHLASYQARQPVREDFQHKPAEESPNR